MICRLLFATVLAFCLATAVNSFSQTAALRTKVITLGTGTPNPDPNRFGPSTAIVVDGVPYIVDCGPGVVRRAVAAGINVALLNRLFITHLHSDHTTGYADFVFTPGVIGRKEPLRVFGPKGISSMNDHILQAYRDDYEIRINGLEKGDSMSYKVFVNEIDEGVVYKDERVTVTAFSVRHGTWPQAFGYKFVTPDRSIVISGDCTYSEQIIKQCNGCDILVHEVYSEDGYSRRSPQWKSYHAEFHTSTSQLAAIANKGKPKLLVLTHQLIWDSSEEKLLQEIKSKYSGKVVSAKDLDEF